jgi:hypothetical protein
VELAGGILVTAGTTTAVVATAAFALVGVLTSLVGTPGVLVTPANGVVSVPVAVGPPAIGVPGVPVTTTPPAAMVCAAAVCFANSSIMAIGFSTEGKGDTNNPVAIRVGVTAGAVDKDCSQAVIKVLLMINTTTASETRFLLLMDSPLLDSTKDGSTSPLKRQAARCFIRRIHHLMTKLMRKLRMTIFYFYIHACRLFY